jgi:molybdopterin-guanine dinucleotide biosynthesis protein A
MGKDKATLEVAGVAMAARVAGALSAAGAAPVIAVGGDRAGLEALGLDWREDRYPSEGPLGAILTVFAELATHELVAVVATDLPYLGPTALTSLVDAVGDHDVALAGADRPEPLCGVWRVARCRPVLDAEFARGERAVHRAVTALDQVVVPVPAQDVRNVNHPDDLAR